MAIKFKGGNAVVLGTSDTAVKRKALLNAIRHLQDMKAAAGALRLEFQAQTTMGPLWRAPLIEELPASVNYIEDLIDREIRRGQDLLSKA